MQVATRQPSVPCSSGRHHNPYSGVVLHRGEALCHRRIIMLSSAASEASSEAAIDVHAPGSKYDVPQELVQEKVAGAMKTLGKAKQKAGMQRVLSESLDSVSLTVVGEDSQLNWAVAQALATRMGWFPVQTSKIVAGLHKDRTLTPAEQAAAEAEVLKGLRTQYRVVASCQGGGAASMESTYRDLYGNFVIWIDEGVAGETKPATPERQLYAAKADVPLKLTTKRGFAAPKPLSLDDKAAAAVDRLMPQMVKFLQQQPGLVAKKKQYVKLGCRGDWPDLKPAEWSPIHDALGRDAVATVPP